MAKASLTLHPYYQAIVDAYAAAGRPYFHQVPAEQARAMLRAALAAAPAPVGLPDLAQVVDQTIDGPHGPVPIRCYVPHGEPVGTCVYFHSGGWVIGDLAFADATCRRLAGATRARIISVDYRKAPEHPFPQPLDDGFAVLEWAAHTAPGPLLLIGESAGGNLAAACAIRARDAGGPALAGQFLAYPVTDHDFETASYRDLGDRNWLLSTADMRYFWDHYCPVGVDRTNPLVSPLRVADPAGLPPTLVFVAQLDPLRDEGLAFARRLAAAGVPTATRCDPGMAHGYLGAAAAIPQVAEALAEAASWITARLIESKPLDKTGAIPLPVTSLPARDIPVPGHLSPAAQATLITAMLPLGRVYPAPDDGAGWRAYIAAMDETIGTMVVPSTAQSPVEVEDRAIAGVPVFVVTPADLAPDDRTVILDMHGGALILGGGAMCRAMAAGVAMRLQARVWSVDYRMPPEHCYPAALDDCLAVYRALLQEREAHQIIVAGGSAGGNLAAALVLRARDEGLPLPAGAILQTPEVDLTETGDSFSTNLGLDPVLGPLMPVNLLYANGHDLTDPYLSPLFADFAKGFVPTILTTGTRDLFLSNTVRMHRALRAAGIPAELHVLEGGAHIGFPGSPEGLEIDAELRRFVRAERKHA